MKLTPKSLYRNARIAMWRRHAYRRKSDIIRDFLLRTTAGFYSQGGQPPISLPLSMRLRQLPDPVYLRLGDSDFLVLDEIFVRGEYTRVKDWNLPPDARILDLGANIGLASLYFASLYPKSQLVAVEPDAQNCALIERNCRRLIDERRLQVIRAFLANKDGVAGIDKGWQAWAFMKVDTVDDKHVAVPCVSMPTLMKNSGFDRIDLLKCDIEGSEREVFRDCASWIGRVKHLVVETHNPYFEPDNPYTVNHLYADLRAAGWEFDVAYELQEQLVGIAFLKAREPSRPSTSSESAAPAAVEQIGNA